MIPALYAFVFAGLFSPGPNIILLIASGARFGLRATLPHILGVAIGVGLVAGLTGFGIGALLTSLPSLTLALKICAAVWILWMAWRLFQSEVAAQDTNSRPFTFHEAVLFQWINPKIWAVAIAASAGYGIGLTPSEEAARLAIAFSGINLFVCSFWTSFGHLLRGVLDNPTHWRMFMGLMAGLLALSALLIFA